MNATELFNKDGDGYCGTGVFYCSADGCRLVYRNKQDADKCCLCCDCENARIVGKCRCEPCGVKFQAAMDDKANQKDKAAMDKAVLVGEYDFEYFWFNDRMYSDMDEFLDELTGDSVEFPEFVHLMKPVKFDGFDLEGVYENFDEDNMPEDMSILDQLDGIKELDTYISDFNKTNAAVTICWIEDRTKKIKVPHPG